MGGFRMRVRRSLTGATPAAAAPAPVAAAPAPAPPAAAPTQWAQAQSASLSSAESVDEDEGLLDVTANKVQSYCCAQHSHLYPTCCALLLARPLGWAPCGCALWVVRHPPPARPFAVSPPPACLTALHFNRQYFLNRSSTQAPDVLCTAGCPLPYCCTAGRHPAPRAVHEGQAGGQGQHGAARGPGQEGTDAGIH
jgi:hypothetical protein